MAANVKITANSTEFNRQMSEMARELKKVKSSYSLANVQAKLFGSTTDILKSKQSELTSKINVQNNMIKTQSNHVKNLNKDLENQKNERDRLNSKIEETNKKYKDSVSATGKNSEESKKLKTELTNLKEAQAKNNNEIDSTIKKLDNAEIKLNNSKKQLLENEHALESVNKQLERVKIDNITNSLDKVGNKAQETGRTLTMGVTTPIVGIGIAAAKVGMDFESNMSRVKAISGATGEDFDKLRNQALDLGSSTAFSANECAVGMENLASAGFDSNKIIEAMPGLLDAAASSGEDLGQVTSVVTGALNGFGLEATQTGHVADVLAKSSADTNADILSMGEAFKYCATPAAAAKQSMEEVSAAIGIMSDSSIEGSQAGTTLRGVFTRLANPSKEAAGAMKDVGFNAFDAQGKMLPLNKIIDNLSASTKGLTDQQKQQFISQVFGQEAMSGMLALMSSGGDKIRKLTKGYEDCDGAAKKIADTMQNNTKGSIDEAMGALETAAINMQTIITPTIKSVAGIITKLANAFNALPKPIQSVIVKTLALTAVIGPMLLVFGKLTKGVSSTIKLMSDLPKNIKKSKESFKDFSTGCKTAGKNILDFSKKIGKIGWTKLTKGVNLSKKSITSFGTGCKTAGKNVLDFSKKVGKIGWSKLTKGASIAQKGVTSFGKGILNVSKNIGTLTLTILKNTAGIAKNGLAWAVNQGKMLAYKTVQLAVTGATKAMTLAQQALNLALNMNPIGIVIIALTSLAAVFVTLYNKCDWFRNGVNAVWNKVKNIFVGFANFFKGAFKRDFTQTFGLLGAPLNSFFGVVNAIWGGIKGVFNGVITFLRGTFTGNWRQVFSGLRQIVKSIFGTIGGIIKAPINAAISGINAAIRGVNRISFTVPSWIPGLGGKHFGVHLPQIPALAEGGIVTQATMALVGEGKEHEAVIPLSKLDKLVTDSVQKVINNKENKAIKEDSGNPKIIQVVLQVGNKSVAEAIFDEFGRLISKKQGSRGIVRGKLKNA
jgi:TP901 family phage tail tape measure protein